MGDKWLITDTVVETVLALEVFAEELQRALTDPYRWKWVILSLHNAVQGMMVLALQSSHGLHVLRPHDAARWLEAHERGGPYPNDLKLDDFLSLYKKIKSDKMLMYIHSQRFRPSRAQGSSVKLLNRLRNEFVHFTPRVWALDIEGLPTMSQDALEVAEFLAWHSGNVVWTEPEIIRRAKTAFISARTSLATMRKNYCSG
jgi:hypothetical protein